jgi:hypothetical protein
MKKSELRQMIREVLHEELNKKSKLIEAVTDKLAYIVYVTMSGSDEVTLHYVSDDLASAKAAYKESCSDFYLWSDDTTTLRLAKVLLPDSDYIKLTTYTSFYDPDSDIEDEPSDELEFEVSKLLRELQNNPTYKTIATKYN